MEIVEHRCWSTLPSRAPPPTQPLSSPPLYTPEQTTSWLWQSRSQLKSAEVDQSKVDVLLGEAVDCCIILLLLKPVGRVPAALDAKSVSGTPCVAGQGVRRRWHKAISVVRATVRWRKVASGSKSTDVAGAVARFIRAMLEIRVYPEKLQKPPDRDNTRYRHHHASVPCLLVLFVLVLHNYQRAATRKSGFEAFHTLAAAVQTPSLLADVLLSLPPALRTPGLVDRHHLTHLSAVSGSAARHVTSAFRTLQNRLLDVLGNLCLTFDGGVVATGPSSAAGGKAQVKPSDHSKECRNPDAIPFDTRTILVLLETWGLTMHSEDWKFMENARVLRVVSLVASKFADHDLSEPDAGGGVDNDGCCDASADVGVASKRGRALRPQSVLSAQGNRAFAACHAAAWMLIRALTIQLHELELGHLRDNDFREDFSIATTMDVLHMELEKCVSKAKSKLGEVEKHKSLRGHQQRDRTPSQSLLEFASPGIGGLSESSPRERTLGGNRAHAGSTSHKRRCQELVRSPRRLMNMEDGLVFPAAHVLNNLRSSDFSITFWLLLGQDRTGHHRSVLARGHRSERWPVLLLRDTDNRLEVRNLLVVSGVEIGKLGGVPFMNQYPSCGKNLTKVD